MKLRSVGVLLFLGLISPGCALEMNLGDLGAQLKSVKTETKTLPAENVSELVVDSRHGSVSLTPSKSNEITIDVEFKAVDDADLQNIKLDAKAEGKAAMIGWSTTDGSFNKRQATFKITAPGSVALRVKTGAGEIRVENFTNGLVAESGAGAIVVDNVVGNLELKSNAGEVKVSKANGVVKAESGAGAVHIEGTPKGDSLAKSGAGEVKVLVTSDSNLTIKADTGAGSVANDFGWKVSGQVSRATTGTIGDGSGGTMSIHTGAGSIRVGKAN